jgi:hypothetical protein
VRRGWGSEEDELQARGGGKPPLPPRDTRASSTRSGRRAPLRHRAWERRPAVGGGTPFSPATSQFQPDGALTGPEVLQIWPHCARTRRATLEPPSTSQHRGKGGVLLLACSCCRPCSTITDVNKE